MNQFIDIFEGSAKYSEYLSSFYKENLVSNVEVNNTEITQAIYFHLYKARVAEWAMRKKLQ